MGHLIKNLEFVTQRQGRRDDKYSCGVACFKMLLKYYFKNNKLPLKNMPSYGQLCKELYNSKAAIKKSYVDKNVLQEYVYDDKTYGAYQEDMVEYLKKMHYAFKKTSFIQCYKVRCKVMFEKKKGRLCKLLKLIYKNIPVMVEIGYPKEEFGHWLVLRGYSESDKKLFLFNPWYKVKQPAHEKPWNVKEFLESWDGMSLCITNG